MSAVPAKAPAYKRVRRQKQFIAVGSVALLAVLGFQLPKLLGGGAQTAPAVTTTALPNLVGSPPIAAVGQLPNSDRVVIQRDSNQLLSFGLFKSKDPFIQQLSTNASTPVASPAANKPKSKPSLAPSSPIGVGLTPLQTTTTTEVTSAGASNPPSSPGAPVAPTGSPGTTPATTTPGAPAPATAPTDVLLSTNGVCERIAVKGTFPANEDIFRLLSIAPGGKSVEVGVVGGSYDSGQATAKLKLGEKLTLVNTADGTRYVIKLESRCNVETPPASATSTAPVAPATPTPTPTPTTTSPIVTDSLDTSFPTN